MTLEQIRNFFLRLLRREQTVESIMSPLTNIVKQLDEYSASKEEAMRDKIYQSQKLAEEARECEDCAQHASTSAEKFRDLLTP